MIADEEYLQLYKMFCDVMEQAQAKDEQRVVYYHPELFVEMAREILSLRQRIRYMQHLELDYEIKAQEVLRLCDVINSVKQECRFKHIKLDTNMDIRTRK